MLKAEIQNLIQQLADKWGEVAANRQTRNLMFLLGLLMTVGYALMYKFNEVSMMLIWLLQPKVIYMLILSGLFLALLAPNFIPRLARQNPLLSSAALSNRLTVFYSAGFSLLVLFALIYGVFPLPARLEMQEQVKKLIAFTLVYDDRVDRYVYLLGLAFLPFVSLIAVYVLNQRLKIWSKISLQRSLTASLGLVLFAAYFIEFPKFSHFELFLMRLNLADIVAIAAFFTYLMKSQREFSIALPKLGDRFGAAFISWGLFYD